MSPTALPPALRRAPHRIAPTPPGALRRRGAQASASRGGASERPRESKGRAGGGLGMARTGRRWATGTGRWLGGAWAAGGGAGRRPRGYWARRRKLRRAGRRLGRLAGGDVRGGGARASRMCPGVRGWWQPRRLRAEREWLYLSHLMRGGERRAGCVSVTTGLSHHMASCNAHRERRRPRLRR